MGNADPEGIGRGLEIRGWVSLPSLGISWFAGLGMGLQGTAAPCLGCGEKASCESQTASSMVSWVLVRAVWGYGRCGSGLELLGWSLTAALSHC